MWFIAWHGGPAGEWFPWAVRLGSALIIQPSWLNLQPEVPMVAQGKSVSPSLGSRLTFLGK